MKTAKMTPACLHFPNYFCMACFFILVLPNSFAQIYISEVLYDPFTSESGGEAVEVYNSGNKAINLSSYTLMTASSSTDATFPEGAIILARGYYLIADTNWDSRKDDITYPKSDYEEPITMKNTDSGVALVDTHGSIVDAVGWGVAPIDSSLYKGTPTNYSENGQSLTRISFTGNNKNDFVSSIPNFINSHNESKDISNNAIDLHIYVPNSSDYIKNVSIPYNYENKLLLSPGREKIINITFLVNKQIQIIDIYSIFNNTKFDVSLMSSTNNYEKYYVPITLDYYTIPGNYSLMILINSSTNTYTKEVSFEIMPLLSFEIDLTTINCSAALNLTCLITGDINISTSDQPTIRNIGNKPLDFKIYATNFTDEQNIININNVKFSLGNNPETTLMNKPTLYNIDLITGPNSMLPLSLLINIPSDAKSGKYKTRLILMGVSHEN